MSPAQDAWEHRAQLELYVQKGDDAQRATDLHQLGQKIAAALNANPKRGGAVERVDWGQLVAEHEAIEGVAAAARSEVTVYLYYETAAGRLA